jgi:sporulation protein YlmC with PRC-barrel domain
MSTASLSNLRNYIVVARAEGLRLGTIAETFIHPSARKLSAIAVKGGLTDTERYVTFDDIELIGEDVVLVANVAAVKVDLGPVAEAGRAFNELRTMPVGTAGGVVLGKLADIDVNAENGLVAVLFFADGRAVTVESEDVTFGRDQIVLPAGCEDRISEPDEERRGFLSKLFSQETVDEVTGTLRRAFRSSDKTNDAVEKKPGETSEPHRDD